MKKTTALLLLAAPFVFSACKKSKDSGPESIYELPYNTEGVTANKAFMETEGREFVKKIDDLSSNPAIDALETFNTLEAPEVDITVNAIKKLGAGTLEIAAVNSVLSTITNSVTEKKSYQLSKAFGIYKWNQGSNDWDLTASNDKIEFQFPATKNGNTNNTVLTITYKNSGKSYVSNSTNYEYVYNPETQSYDVVETYLEETFELPSEVVAKMTINNSEVMNLSSLFTYHDDKLPKLINVNLTLGSYVAKLEVNSDDKVAGTKFSFIKNSETLLALEANSNFSALSHDNLVNAEDDEVLDLFVSANTTFSVGNVTLGGQIDYKSIHNELKTVRDKEPAAPNWDTYFGSIKYPNYNEYPNEAAYQQALTEYNEKFDAAYILYNAAYKKYDSDHEKYEKEYYTLLANLLNKHAAAVAVNTKTKKKIASITFELKDDVFQYDDVTIHYYDVEPLLVFGDGSKVSFEVFGETGFENLTDDIEALLEKFEN